MAAKEQSGVIIVGAGVSGLLVAQGLKKHGIPFSIFESEPSADETRWREWGMSIQWALPMLPNLLSDDLMSRLPEATVDPHYEPPEFGNAMAVFNAETGEKIKDIPLVKWRRMSRHKFRALLTEGIDVQYGKTVRSVDSNADDIDISVTFTDETKAKGSLLICADGANSACRRSIFPGGDGNSELILYGGANIHVCYHDAKIASFIRESISPLLAIGIHPNGYWLWLSVQDVPDPEKPEDWVFQLQWTFKTGDMTARLAALDLKELKQEAESSFGEPFKTAWLNIPEGTKVPVNKVSIWHPQPIPSEDLGGKAVLVGDSAHAMSFHRGQGLNHGIADACKLVQVLTEAREGKKSQKDAVLEYEAEMIKRAGEEVIVSRKNTEMVHDWEKVKDSPFMQRGGDKNK